MTATRPEPALPLKRAIPPGRTYESVLHHFEVERKIARRLKAADREQRKVIYSSMYDELFAKVPDHPRLTRRSDPLATQEMNRRKLHLLHRFLKKTGSFLEFGPGDCRFAFDMAERVKRVYAVDIADQIGSGVERPENFELVVYNGYDLDLPENSIDVAFSDQLIEHLHPEDTEQPLQDRPPHPQARRCLHLPHATPRDRPARRVALLLRRAGVFSPEGMELRRAGRAAEGPRLPLD